MLEYSTLHYVIIRTSSRVFVSVLPAGTCLTGWVSYQLSDIQLTVLCTKTQKTRNSEWSLLQKWLWASGNQKGEEPGSEGALEDRQVCWSFKADWWEFKVSVQELRNLDPFLLLDEFEGDSRDGAGFPDHPHRGFETVSYLLEGEFTHEDFAGIRKYSRSCLLNWRFVFRTTQTATSPITFANQRWAIINELESMIDSSSFSRSGLAAQLIIMGWSDSEFQTGNSSITLQKWSCEVWSWLNFEIPKDLILSSMEYSLETFKLFFKESV